MNPESPKFEAKTTKTFSIPDGAKMLVFEQTFFNEAPATIKEDGVPFVAIPVPSISSPEVSKEAEAPTESQLFWRDMYRTGKLSPYQKERPSIDLSAAAEAWKNPQSQGVESKILAVDLALRGGADKEYNQLGEMGTRAKRMGVMAANIIPFTAFDIATSIPGNLFIEGVKIARVNYATKQVDDSGADKKTREAMITGLLDGTRRAFEIGNDKFTTAMGDSLVQKLTGEKGGWTREASDKTGDFLDGAVGMYLEDTVNGPTVESVMRLIYQIPVAGALVEQGWTKLTLLQEKSPFSKATGKAIFGGLGTMFGTINALREADKKVAMEKLGLDYKEPTSPSKIISKWVWKLTPWGKSVI